MADPGVVREIRRVARRKHASPKEVKAAFETGIVESGLQNLSGGDADSAGWRQERASLYPDPTNVTHAAERFFDEARGKNVRGISAGELAARVQRPAAQYRGRYQDVADQAEAMLRAHGEAFAQSLPGESNARVELGHKTTFDQAGFDQAKKRFVLAGLLAKHGTDSPLFKTGVLSLTAPNEADFSKTALTSKIVGGATGSSSPSSSPSNAPSGGTAMFDGKRVAAWMVPALKHARANGWKGKIASGVRTRAEQEALYANRGANPFPVAKPGSSNHELENGGAVDVSDPEGLARAMRNYRGRKLKQGTAIGDPIHFSASGR